MHAHHMNEETLTPPQPETRSKYSAFVSEIIRFALIALFVVLPIRLYIAQPFVVSGSSMDSTFENGQYLIVDEISYRFEEPKRGEVIIFRYPNDTTKFFIKRIIGLPGETVSIDGSVITIINTENPDGFVLNEEYLSHKTNSRIRMQLQDDEYFVMGDNREASSDSRIWGPLPKNLIIGRAFLRLLPLSGIGIFPGNHTYINKAVTTDN